MKYKGKRENNMVKNYIKPEIEFKALVSDNNISSLATWLEQSDIHEDVSIVTYVLQS